MDPQRPVVLLSHRGPVSFGHDDDGKRTATRGAGGLVTALTGLAGQLDDAVWVCAAAGDDDREVAQQAGGQPVRVALTPEALLVNDDEHRGEDSLLLRLVEVDPVAHADFYGVVSNPLLWFLQHGLYGLADVPDLGRRERSAFENGYAAVNEVFADAVIAEVTRLGGSVVVMLHDYHFYLVAERVRAACPDAVVSHFVHIPWPGPDAWRLLPADMRERILHGLLGNDVVAFHTQRYARNFLLSAQELLGLPVDLESMSVEVAGRQVRARTYPISIDVEALTELADSEPVRRTAAHLKDTLGNVQLMLRVDRTDPSKNIVRGFRAYGQLLDDHPEHAGQAIFLALLQPSRQDVPEYADYLARIGAAAAAVNARHGTADWTPVHLRFVEDLPLAVAAYSICDVLVVNSVADGMNLVAKEAVVVNRRDGVLALSENTGAHEELGDYAVTLHPFDLQQQADALHRALTMPAAERAARRQAAADVVRRGDVGHWISRQLDDLVPSAPAPQPPAAQGQPHTPITQVLQRPLESAAQRACSFCMISEGGADRGSAAPLRVVIDAANVVGSRPDGWWRDRSAAARRLIERLARLASAGVDGRPTTFVVVLEGTARTGNPIGVHHPGVEVTHASASGDDEVVRQVRPGQEAVVVTADRALAERVRQRGACVVGPRWLADKVKD